MKRLILLSMASALVLSACGKSDEPAKNTVAPAPKPTAEEALKIEQQKVNQTFEEALNAIPPELRDKHQAILTCVIEKNNKLPLDQQQKIGPDTVLQITEQLKVNPNLSGC